MPGSQTLANVSAVVNILVIVLVRIVHRKDSIDYTTRILIIVQGYCTWLYDSRMIVQGYWLYVSAVVNILVILLEISNDRIFLYHMILISKWFNYPTRIVQGYWLYYHHASYFWELIENLYFYHMILFFQFDTIIHSIITMSSHYASYFWELMHVFPPTLLLLLLIPLLLILLLLITLIVIILIYQLLFRIDACVPNIYYYQ